MAVQEKREWQRGDAGSHTGQKEERPSENQQQDQKGDKEDKNPRTSVWEWVIAFVGLVLVVGSIGFMLYQAIWGDQSPPDVTVRVEAVTQMRSGFLVNFQAFNHGGSTAEGIIVQGELKRGTESAETSETTVDYLPAKSERKGGLFFSKDPRLFELQVRAFGYEEP